VLAAGADPVSMIADDDLAREFIVENRRCRGRKHGGVGVGGSRDNGSAAIRAAG
jgi:hypothetical protein